MAGSTIVDEQVTTYLQRVRDLYAAAREWLGDAAAFEEREIQVTEGPIAAYAAPVLTVRRPSRLPVEFVPKGWRIIGGYGRVDLASKVGSETLVYVAAGGPQLATWERTTGCTGSGVATTPLFSGIDHDGWAWIEQRLPGKARMLTSEVLAQVLDLLDR